MKRPADDTIATRGEILLYQAEDGSTRIDVRVEDNTVWLTQAALADLFQRDKSVISRHIKNIFDEGELAPEAVVANFATTASDGKTYQVAHFHLDVVIAVGYRVKSHRGTQFRIWATQRLGEFIVKGFTMDDERLKQAGGGSYFDELLARIRDIRSSEKVFWRKVLDIYATSIDYDARAEATEAFFKTVQNKMHWAAHGHTAAEVIAARVDASLPNLGLTSWAGARPRKADVSVAKNYLDAAELDALNRIVVAYLEFAEMQAVRRRPMTMRAWIAKLDDFLKLSDHDLLTHAGKVSHDMAMMKAEAEFGKYARQILAEPTRVEKDFDEAARRIEKLPAPRKSKGKPKGDER